MCWSERHGARCARRHHFLVLEPIAGMAAPLHRAVKTQILRQSQKLGPPAWSLAGPRAGRSATVAGEANSLSRRSSQKWQVMDRNRWRLAGFGASRIAHAAARASGVEIAPSPCYRFESQHLVPAVANCRPILKSVEVA